MELLLTFLLMVGVLELEVTGRSMPSSNLGPDSDPGLDEPWLADFDGGTAERYVDYFDGMQADAPSSSSSGGKTPPPGDWVCPPPPQDKAPAHYCHMKQCKSDMECQGPSLKCCYNGCLYSCLSTLPPPPLVDWIKEPPRRLLAGNSWLVQGPEMVVPGGKDYQDSCSTDFDPMEEDALLCAHGYICYILYPGDKAKGIPNRGRCMKEDSTQYQESRGHRRFRLATSGQQGNNGDENVCIFENAIFVDGAQFMYQHHQCECLKSTIMCTVGEDPTEE